MLKCSGSRFIVPMLNRRQSKKHSKSLIIRVASSYKNLGLTSASSSMSFSFRIPRSMTLPLFLLPSVRLPEGPPSHVRRHPNLIYPSRFPPHPTHLLALSHALLCQHSQPCICTTPIAHQDLCGQARLLRHGRQIDRGVLPGLPQSLLHRGKGCFNEISYVINFWLSCRWDVLEHKSLIKSVDSGPLTGSPPVNEVNITSEPPSHYQVISNSHRSAVWSVIEKVNEMQAQNVEKMRLRTSRDDKAPC